MSDKKIRIKQATKKGYIEMDLGGCATSAIQQANSAEVVYRVMAGYVLQLPLALASIE